MTNRHSLADLFFLFFASEYIVYWPKVLLFRTHHSLKFHNRTDIKLRMCLHSYINDLLTMQRQHADWIKKFWIKLWESDLRSLKRKVHSNETLFNGHFIALWGFWSGEIQKNKLTKQLQLKHWIESKSPDRKAKAMAITHSSK